MPTWAPTLASSTSFSSLHCFGLLDETCGLALEQSFGCGSLGGACLFDCLCVGFLDSNLGQAFLFQGDSVGFFDLHSGETNSRFLRLLTLGESSHRTGFEIGSFEIGFGHRDTLASKAASGCFLGFGLLDVLDELALCFGLGQNDRCFTLTVGVFDDAEALDRFFLLGDSLFDGHTIPLDVCDLGTLTLEFLLGCSCLDETSYCFELTGLGYHGS